MPDDQNTTQNQDSEKNSIPPSPQEPMVDVPVPVTDSIPVDIPPEALETPTNADIPVSLNNDNIENIPVLAEKPEEIRSEELPTQDTKTEEIPSVSSEPAKASETGTAQIPVSEPLNSTSEPIEHTQDKPLDEQLEIKTPEVKPEPTKEETKQTETKISEPKIITESKPNEKPEPVEIKTVPVLVSAKLSQKNLWKRFLDKVQIGKRKKLEKIMTMFLKKSKITNDEVEKFLHVSDATATRYLSQLKKEGKIKQTGKTGHAVSYSRI